MISTMVTIAKARLISSITAKKIKSVENIKIPANASMIKCCKLVLSLNNSIHILHNNMPAIIKLTDHSGKYKYAKITIGNNAIDIANKIL